MEKSERRKRFERVASYRVQKILDDIHSLNSCSNKNNYEYSESDVEQMFSEISKAVQEKYYNRRNMLWKRADGSKYTSAGRACLYYCRKSRVYHCYVYTARANNCAGFSEAKEYITCMDCGNYGRSRNVFTVHHGVLQPFIW